MSCSTPTGQRAERRVPRRRRAGHGAGMDAEPTIRPAEAHELPAAASLLAGALGFGERDAIPAWLMRTTDESGGVTLVALLGGRVIGVSYAFPAWTDGQPSLFSCGLAVAPGHRGRRLGLELKLAQRRIALSRGFETIRWTTDPVNGRALRLYLSGLGAVVTGYRAALHDGLRTSPGHPQDDVDVIWPLEGPPRVDERDVRRVELPWERAAAHDRTRVRRAMCELLADGYVGTAFELDRAARRCAVAFNRLAS
jgi:GNAT superfamily N-acetyltransferase